MNLHDWIDEVCDTLDIEVEVDEGLVLDLARDAAEGVERPAAPITTFLLGYAAAQAGGSPEAVERLAGLVSDLAGRWDKPADAADEDGDDDDADGGTGDFGDLDLTDEERDEEDEERDEDATT